MSVIRDASLAPKGRQKMRWAWDHMDVLRMVADCLKKDRTLEGRRIVVCCHLEAKTACLGLALKSAGAHVAVTGSNPLSTQDDVAAALAEEGVSVFAWRGATVDEYMSHLGLALDTRPDLIVDDGGDLVGLLHTDKSHLIPGLIGGCEETTTGVLRLRSMRSEGLLAFPMIAVNDARMKYLFDNRYGTGQSVWDGIIRSTNLSIAGRVVVVAGYGWCGKGIAMRARGLGARVLVTEVDPVKALEAMMDGYEAMPMGDAAPLGDIFITATGCKDVIRAEHMQVMKDGAVLANAGHFDVEVSVSDLSSLAVNQRSARDSITEYRLASGKRLYLMAEGRLVNLAAADGHPVEVMDMSFAIQALSLRWLATQDPALEPGVYAVPAEIDDEVAKARLSALGKAIDVLSEAQKAYLSGWREGTR